MSQDKHIFVFVCLHTILPLDTVILYIFLGVDGGGRIFCRITVSHKNASACRRMSLSVPLITIALHQKIDRKSTLLCVSLSYFHVPVSQSAILLCDLIPKSDIFSGKVLYIYFILSRWHLFSYVDLIPPSGERENHIQTMVKSLVYLV